MTDFLFCQYIIKSIFAIINLHLLYLYNKERVIKINKNEPFLYFNFINTNNKIEPLQFNNPIKIIKTNSSDQVLSCLTQVEQAVNNGYYAAGYLSYEAASGFNSKLTVSSNINQIPLLWFGIYTKPTRTILDSNKSFNTSSWVPTVTRDKYFHNINRIHDYIKQNTTEQVNYTIKLKSSFDGEPFAFYKQMEEAQSANYSAYLNTGDHTIMSASPELFFQLKNNVITTKPMKGTIERGKTYEEDIEKAKWLKTSSKNRTENELITKLISEELNQFTIPYTTKTTKPFDIEKYPTLYQMTSTVQGNILPEVTIVDIFKQLFPAGSITGSPKSKTMKIINSLETEPREIYCGAIGYITPDREAIFNVPIRTVLLDNKTNKLEYGVGGGITIDSEKEEEYNEVLTKAKLLTKERTTFQLLETIGIKDGKYIILDLHLKRLKNSGDYFDFDLKLNDIKMKLKNLVKIYPDNEWKVRLLVNKNGEFSVEVEQIYTSNIKKTVLLADQPIDKNNQFLYHKTTYRAIYETHQVDDDSILDVLLWNEDSEITEFTTGNIVIKLNDKLVTPPVECGLLPGTFRSQLLKNKTITEQKITKNDLTNAEEIWYINSVREWLLVELK